MGKRGPKKDYSVRAAVLQEHYLDPESTLKEMAERVGTSIPTMSKIYGELGFQAARPHKLRPSLRGENYAKAVALRKASPCMSLQDIGNELRISRERVRQILARDGRPTQHIVPATYYCMNCGKPTRNTPRRWRRYVADNEVFCSGKCATDFHTLTLTCEVCGKLFQRSVGDVINNARHRLHKAGRFFCSRACQGKWLGTHYGDRTGINLRSKVEAK